MTTKTITFKGIELEVEYDYQPEEPADNSGYPGCGSAVELYEVRHKGEDILDLLDEYEITDIVLTQHETSDEYDY